MIFIDKVPEELEELMSAAVAPVSKPQQYWLAVTTLAMMCAYSRRNVKALSTLLDPAKARSTLNDFMSRAPWPAPEVLMTATLHVLGMMDLQPGERIEVICDGTQKAKRGEMMDGLTWVKEATDEEWRKGHRLLLSYLRVRGVMLPLAVDVYLSKKFLASAAGKELRRRDPTITFRTLNEMAAAAIARLPGEWADKFEVVVLLDSGFCNDTACSAVTQKGFHYVVAAQSTRVLVKCTKDGRKGQRVVLAQYAPGRLRYQGTSALFPPKRHGGKWRRFRLAESTGMLRNLGLVKVVFSRRASDGNILCLVTSNLDMAAREVALSYGWRWEIEVTIKGLKGRLGLGQYQCRYYEGMVHHLHLSLLAHLGLTVAELKRRGHEVYNKRAALQLPSIRVLQGNFRRRLWRNLLEQLKPRCSDQTLLSRIERALSGAA
jgi:SRSO17 transposase